MRRAAFSSLLLFFFTVSALPAAALPQLFQKAKEQFRLGSYAAALATLSEVEKESEKPENQANKTSVRPSLAFYRGACLAALDRQNEAREEFEVFLAYSPNASLDPAVYPKKVIAALKQTRLNAQRTREAAPEKSSITAADYAYSRNVDARNDGRPEDWAEGPVRYLLRAEDRRSFSQLLDPVARSEFVTAFWKARDPRPETPENEFREEFEKRVAYADAHFAQDEVRGSLTDRGMVFLLLGPPTYVGRRPIKSGEDTDDPTGMSRFTRNDVTTVQKTMGNTPAASVAIDTMTGPANTMPDAVARWQEVWHYRRELLPKEAPYQQVDFEFITRKGYGKNVLQREETVLNTLDAARSAVKTNP